MAPKSTRNQSYRKPKLPQLVIPCLTDLRTLLKRHPGLEINFSGNVVDLFTDNDTQQVLTSHNKNRSNKRNIEENITRFKKPRITKQTSPKTCVPNKTSVSAERRENKTSRRSSRGRSNPPQSLLSHKKPRGPLSKQKKESDPNAKPGTAGSRDALDPPKRNQRPSAKKTARVSDDEDSDKVQMTRIVDDTIIISLAQLVDLHKIQNPPENPLDLCRGFSIPITDLGLMSGETTDPNASTVSCR